MPIAPFLLASMQNDDDPLARHLEHLYSLAQVLTLSSEDAAQLVEATYRSATRKADSLPPEPMLEDWLVRHMMQLHRERELASNPVDLPGASSTDAPQPDDLRRRLTEAFVERELPAAFATLSSDQRLLLVLCEVEERDLDEAALVLGTDLESARAGLEEARAVLDARLQEAATESERRLMLTSLPPGWRRSALRQMTESALSPLPPTLYAQMRDSGHGERRPLQEVKPPEPAVPSKSFGHRFQRILVMLLLIAVAGGGLYLSSRYVPKERDADLITVSALKAQDASLTFRTESPEQAERYVRDRLSWRLTVPGIDRASLRGVGIRQITPAIEVPVFLYDDTVTGQTVSLFAYNYSLLDRNASQVSLEADILRQIEDEGHFDLHDLGAERVLVWRHRDEIYVAVTSGDAEELRERIFFPS